MKRLFPLTAACMSSMLAADIPIREVILYKSGVGYFERAGTLSPGESARLDFKASDMNDVLKSLTLEDRNGSKVTGLRYDSSEPLAQKLAEFPFQVDGHASLSAFLGQVRGARIELKFSAETVSGAIVSARIAAAQEKQPEREQVVLFLDSGELRTFDLAAASSIRFADAKLQTQLKDYLAAVNQSRSKDKRSIYIDSSDAKERQIAASYMLPTPVWKSSYRLIFDEKSESTLEGWAIVDNTTGDDWNNVRLAVVSGRPVSFISRLYEPKYVTRQVAELPEDQAAAPVVYGGAMVTEPVAGMLGGVSPGPPPPAAAERSAFNRLSQMSKVRNGPMNGRDEENAKIIDSVIAVNVRSRRSRRAFRISLWRTRHGEERRIRHAAVPAAKDRLPQTADLLGKLRRASHERGRTDQLHRQDVRRRPHHGLRRLQLRG